MHKHLAVITVFLAILSNSEATPGQNITSPTPRGDTMVEANDSGTSNKAEDRKDVSPQASAEAKRLYKEAVRYDRSRLFRQASQLYEKAVQLNPTYVDAHYSLGYAYFGQGRWEEAVRSFETAIRINPKDRRTRAGLNEARILAGRNTGLAQHSEELTTANNAPPPHSWAESRPRNVTAASVPVSLNASADSLAHDPKPASTAAVESSASPATVESPASTATVERSALTPTVERPASTGGSDLTSVYRIGIGDVLDVRLGNDPATQSTLFTVTPSGLLEHPILAAPIQVSGLTVEQTQARLEADLKRRAVNENPRVLVGVREYLSHAIIVSGLVKEPGTKLLRREAIPLYVVIADAQPLPEAGSATLIAHQTGEVVVVDLSKPAEMNRLVGSGDVITVRAPLKQFFYVGGEVKAPGEIQFRTGLTLTQAILTAGGLSRESKRARIARANDEGFLASTPYKLKEINTGKLADPLIQPGDRITVEH